jgi:hypothetical protein
MFEALCIGLCGAYLVKIIFEALDTREDQRENQNG